MTNEGQWLEVSRHIAAAPSRVFAILSDPKQHSRFDGSNMLRGGVDGSVITQVGDIFVIKMHRMGRDYEMINHVVDFEPDRLIAWTPAPGDIDTAGGDPTRIGVPSGYRWGFRVEDVDGESLVTEFFDCGPSDNSWILLREGGAWINGSNPVVDSMAATLERLDTLSTS